MDTLHASEQLVPGQELRSRNGRYSLTFQGDGNLVLYTVTTGNWPPCWSAGTAGAGATRAVMQADGNFVLYADDGHAVWDYLRGPGFVKSPMQAGSRLVIQDDRNLVVRAPNNAAIWDSGTATGDLTDLGGPDLTYHVTAVDNGFLVVRVQGIKLELASTQTMPDRIALTVRLHGRGAVSAEEKGECRRCNHLTVTHRYYGFNTGGFAPVQLFQNAGYFGVIEAAGGFSADVQGGVDFNP